MSSDLWQAIQQAYTDAAFAEQVRGDARRILICHPDDEHRVRASVDQHFMADILTVQTSRVGPPPGTMYVIDQAGLDASMAETMQSFMRQPVYQQTPDALNLSNYSAVGQFRALVEKLHTYHRPAPTTQLPYPLYADWMPYSHRRQGRTAEFQAAVEAALLTGEHVHTFGTGGFKCLTGECE